MRLLFTISVVLSGLITVAVIGVTQYFTPTFDAAGTNEMGGNGNAALFFIVFAMPIILYFLFAMVVVFEKLHTKYHVNRKRFIAGYTTLFLVLMGYTCYKIITFNKMAQPYFEEKIGYLNPYTNDLFFNIWTLLAALCLMALLSFYTSRSTK